jgi:hypothetical protein
MVLAPNRKEGPEMNKSEHYIKFKHYIPAVAVVVLVWAFTASSRAQKYSDWSEPINPGPTVNSAFNNFSPAISKDVRTGQPGPHCQQHVRRCIPGYLLGLGDTLLRLDPPG